MGRNDYSAGPIPISVGTRAVAHTLISHSRINDPIPKLPTSPVSPFARHNLEPTSTAAINQPIASVQRQRSLFDDILPREIQLQCFEALLVLHKDEYQRALRKARGQSEKRADAVAFLQKRWVGEIAGRRELLKLMRVSRGEDDLAAS